MWIIKIKEYIKMKCTIKVYEEFKEKMIKKGII